MKIDQSQPGVTTIRDRPLLVPAFCLMFVIIGVYTLVERTVHGKWDFNAAFGVTVCFLIGGGIFLYAARRADFRFDCRSRRLTWSIRHLLGRQDGELAFDDIHRVAVHCGPEYGDTTYRVVLYTPDEMMPLSNAYTANKRQLERVANAIETALTDVAADHSPTRTD